MPLTGTFDILDFSEVLRLLARQALTGRLHLRSRAFNANLFFEDGQIVGADQADHQAAAAAGDVRGRLDEICFEMLEAERGSFEFQAGKTAIMPGDTRLKVETVISGARKRLQEWHELQTVIPSMDLAPQLVIDLEQAEITIDRERWRLLTAVDGRRTLRAIGRLLDMSDFDTCRVVRSLLEGGIVQLDERAAALAFAMSPDADGPPVTEKVTTVHGKQAVRAASPTPAGERTRARIEAARKAAMTKRAASGSEERDGGLAADGEEEPAGASGGLAADGEEEAAEADGATSADGEQGVGDVGGTPAPADAEEAAGASAGLAADAEEAAGGGAGLAADAEEAAGGDGGTSAGAEPPRGEAPPGGGGGTASPQTQRGEEGPESGVSPAAEGGEEVVAGTGQPLPPAWREDGDRAGEGSRGKADGRSRTGLGGSDEVTPDEGAGGATSAGGSSAGGSSAGGGTTGGGVAGTEAGIGVEEGAAATGEIPAASLPAPAPTAAAERGSRPRRVVRIRSKLPKRAGDA